MLELYDIVHNHQEMTFDDLMEWLHRKDVCYMPSKHAMRAKLERNKVKSKKLRGTKKEEFLDAIGASCSGQTEHSAWQSITQLSPI